MSRSLRRATLVLAAVTVLASMALLLRPAYALKEIRIALPVPPPPPTPPATTTPGGPGGDDIDNSGLTLPRDNSLRDKIRAAEDYIREKDWATATRTLQLLIDRPQDVFVQLTRAGRDGKEVKAWVSVKSEANRLLGSLPREGMEFYQLTYGPRAADMLKQARRAGDRALMAQVMTRYLYTEAGGEATNWLGSYMLDRGDYVAAARYFKRLLDRHGATKVSPKVLFKAAYAFHQAGDSANEKSAWELLQDRAGELQLGKQTKTVSELQEYVGQLVRAHALFNATDALVYRGNPARNAQYPGGTAFMEPAWSQPTYRNKDTTLPWIDQARKLLATRKQPVLTSFFPITVTYTYAKEGKKVPLVIYRSYWGIHAVDARTGELQWETPSDWGIDRMLDKRTDARNVSAINSWLNAYITTNGRPHLLFDNSTLGTLSSDGTFVYAIDDLALPPVGNNTPHGAGNTHYSQYGQKIADAVHHNHLRAFELSSDGKLRWELGGTGEKSGELGDSFFLGAPLPMGGRLYVLVEKQQELRLVCIDPRVGKVVAQQTLAATREKMEQDVNRRTQAVHLAYGEGILVCPTNAGAVFGVDLLSNSLVWAYGTRSRDEVPATPYKPRAAMGIRRVGPAVPVAGGGGLNTHWRVTAPVIARGKVVLTAPDSKSIHCVNLRDGVKQWALPRQEHDLYLAGVFNGKVLIVGQQECRALSLRTGDTLWALPTGLPSGQGVASGNVYYLPLQQGVSGDEPEICAIDVERGVVMAHTKSRKRQDGQPAAAPGNLLFYEGDVLSQTPTEIVSYPQLQVKIAQMDERIGKNPNDPVGLTERGELRLDKGDLPGAVTDLRKALDNKPPKDTHAKARAKLFDTLTEYLQRDFDAAEGFLPEYEELCKIDLDGAEGPRKEELLARQRERRANFLRLVAMGREKQGKLVEAFEKYREFAATAGKDELIPGLGEPGVKTVPEVWSRGRIAAMVSDATAAQRKPLEELVARQWDRLRDSGGLDELRSFVRMFGPLSAVGKEARLRLAERLAESNDPRALLEAELNLNMLRNGDEKPEMAARAVEALARLNTRKGLLEDAAYFYRLLGTRYANVPVRDGKTGEDLYNELATDKRFLPYLDEPARLGFSRGETKVTAERGSFPPINQTYYFSRDGEPLPFFDRYRVAFRFDYHQLKLIDRDSGEDRWSRNLTRTMFQNMVQIGGQNHRIRFSFHNAGHLVVLPLGHMVFGIDPVRQEVLWEKNLLGHSPVVTTRPGMTATGYQNLTVNSDGSIDLLYPDGWVQRLGGLNRFDGSVLCLQTRDGIEGLDPLTGRTLWSRSNVGTREHVFADGRHVFVVSLSGGKSSSTRVFRIADGIEVKGAPDFAAAYENRIGQLGRLLLLSETDVNTAAITVRLFDPLDGKDLWKHTFAPKAVLLQSEVPNLVGAYQPETGDVTVFDLRDRKQVLTARMKPEHLAKVQTVHLLADRHLFYLTCSRPVDANKMPFGGVRPNVMNGRGLRSLPVNGMVYAFLRGTGKLKWYADVPDQQMILSRFEDLPMLLFTCNYQTWVNGPGRGIQQKFTAVSIDKRTGKRIYENDSLPNGMYFHTLRVDARAGTVELINQMMKIRYSMIDGEGKAARAGGAVRKTEPLPDGPRRRGAVPPGVEVAPMRIPRR